jgi:hypothetical protein
VLGCGTPYVTHVPKREVPVETSSSFKVHISYVTTPQEYDSQTYEGASNYWGAATGPYLKSGLAELAGTLENGESATPMSWKSECYEPGTRCTFEPRNAWGSVWDPDEGIANIVRDPETDDPKRDFPPSAGETRSLRWSRNPGRPMPFGPYRTFEFARRTAVRPSRWVSCRRTIAASIW